MQHDDAFLLAPLLTTANDEAQWVSLSDLMTGLMMIFLLLTVIFMLKTQADAKAAQEQLAIAYDAIKHEEDKVTTMREQQTSVQMQQATLQMQQMFVPARMTRSALRQGSTLNGQAGNGQGQSNGQNDNTTAQQDNSDFMNNNDAQMVAMNKDLKLNVSQTNKADFVAMSEGPVKGHGGTPVSHPIVKKKPKIKHPINQTADGSGGTCAITQ